MNYFEHHIGDYAEATGHLTFVEDAAYSRMIRKYYAQEKPLPADVKQVQRLVGARSREEKVAVDTVLQEFFFLDTDGWRNKRCDAEIARFQEGEPEREAKKANEETRMKRHREERARLFATLTEAGQHAAWNIGMNELRALIKALPAAPATPPETGPETFLPPLPATAPATPVTATHTQSPYPVLVNNQNLEASRQASNEVDDDLQRAMSSGNPAPTHNQGSTRNVQISVLLRAGGIDATSSNPLVCLDWAENPKVTDELLGLAVVKARTAKPDQRISVNYLKPIVAELLIAAEAKPTKPKQNDWAWKRSNPGIEAKGREMGMYARSSESYADFAERIQQAIDKRKGAAA
jgi:uncharacterized protein YdaU (DUF1376 family)